MLLAVTMAFAVGVPTCCGDEAAAPVSVELTTGDGLTLAATYYASDAGKEAPVVVLLPDEKDSRSSLAELALALQDPGGRGLTPAAVLAIDPRGQGDSRPTGAGAQRKRSGRDDVAMMVRQDLEAARKWLVTKNDARELNVNRLAYVGVGRGSVVALNGAALDWSTPDLPSSKQGRDVKAVVLVSPQWESGGLGVLAALREPGVQSEVAMLLMHGSEDRTQLRTANKIAKQLERARGEPGSASENPLPNLVVATSPTKLGGSALLKARGESAATLISRFLHDHVALIDAPWSRRRID